MVVFENLLKDINLHTYFINLIHLVHKIHIKFSIITIITTDVQIFFIINYRREYVYIY